MHIVARAQEGGGIYYIPVAAMCCTVKKGDLALLLPAKNAFVHVLTIVHERRRRRRRRISW